MLLAPVFRSTIQQDGELRVASGSTLTLDGGYIGGTIDGGGSVELGEGTYSFDNPTVVSGTALDLAGGSITVAAGQRLSVPSLRNVDGTLNGSGRFVLTGHHGVALLLNGGVTLENSGSIAGSVGLDASTNFTTTFLNDRGAVIRIGGDNETLYTNSNFTGQLPVVVNHGTVLIGHVLTTTISAFLNNTGLIKISAGTLSLTGGGRSAAESDPAERSCCPRGHSY